MSNAIVELLTVDDLDRFLSGAGDDPILIYKHSVSCGTSGMAFEEIQDLMAGPPIGATVAVIIVQAARDVSNEVASRFGIRHETPQVLLIQDNRVVWHASHFRVTAEAVSSQLTAISPTGR